MRQRRHENRHGRRGRLYRQVMVIRWVSDGAVEWKRGMEMTSSSEKKKRQSESKI